MFVQDTIKNMLVREIMRILRCGPSKRPATNSIYNKNTSHPSMTNLNDSASANSFNRGNYATRLAVENNVGPMSQSAGLYGNTPVMYEMENVYQTKPKNPSIG